MDDVFGFRGRQHFPDDPPSEMFFAVAGTVPALQNANVSAQTVSRGPQTTAPASDASNSFVHESRKCNLLAFTQTSNAFGALITKTLKPTPGYLRGLWFVFTGTGGVNGTNTVSTGDDAPWNLVQSIQLRDAFGTVVYQSDGYGMYLIHIYSGQVGAVGLQDPTKDTFYSAISTGASGTGNFTYALYLPLEFDPDTAYCSLASMNTAAQMALTLQLNTSANFYGTTSPGTLPVIEVDVYEEYWAVPISDPSLPPPDDGSSAQWSQSQGQNLIGSASNTAVPLPDVGTYIHTLICLFRGSTGLRIDTPFSSDLELWVDSVPWRVEHSNLAFSRMFRLFGMTRPRGSLVYTWRDSVGTAINIDDMSQLLPTTPGTSLELKSGAWGTISANPPATVFAYTGKLYPVTSVPDRIV
jgi:hypothetical protein